LFARKEQTSEDVGKVTAKAHREIHERDERNFSK
jgi:hypothetical protein